MEERDQNTPTPSGPQLGTVVLRARFALFWEKLWPAAWPAVGVIGLWLSLALLDFFPLLPPWLHLVLLALFGLAACWALWRLVRSVYFPDERAGRRRVEQASGLSHRPLTGLYDNLSETSNEETARLWDLHRQRLARTLSGLTAGLPRPEIARRDPFAVRAGLMLLFAVALVAGAGEYAVRLAGAVSPHFKIETKQSQIALDLWVSPPDYTGLPPIFPLRVKAQKPTADAKKGEDASGDAAAEKKDGPVDLEIPEGSIITAQMQGAGASAVLVLPASAKTDEKNGQTGEKPTADRVPFEQVDELNSRIAQDLNDSGRLAVEANGDVLASWDVKIIKDAPPQIKFSVPITATPQATMRLAFEATDDYGIRKARMEIRRTYEKGAVIGKETVKLELPLPGEDARAAKEVAFFDLAPHKWAGAPVIIELIAVDGKEQEGRSEPLKVRLPARQFVHPVARAIIEQRRGLMSDAADRNQVIGGLQAIATQPQSFSEDVVIYLALRSAAARLVHERGAEAIQTVAELLWDTALRLEDGQLSVAEREMRRLQQALMKALAEGASQEELDRLMRQLQAAIQRYMQALAEQMRRNPQSVQEVEFNPETMRLMSQNDIQRMMQQIRDLMRSGQREAARQMLARLQQLLANMRSMQVMRSRGGRMGRQGGALRKLQQLIRRQQQLMDRTFQFGRPGGAPQGQMPGPGDQRALQQLLQQLQGNMQGQGRDGPGQFLNNANRAMERAIRALQGNRPNDAVSAQGRALQQLRQAGRTLMQQLRERFSRQSGQGQRNGRDGPRRDPLGREIDEDDGFYDGDVNIDAPSALKRTREILDELRRRSGERMRPRIELDYIDRLLERF